MIKIVSQLAPGHFDGCWLGICLLKALHPKAQIEHVHPQEVPEEYLRRKDVYLVGVGMRYEPQLNNFDHHQDLGLPSSAILILKRFYPEVDTSARFLQAIDKIDRFGFQSALKEGLVRENMSIAEKRRVLLLMEITPQVARITTQAIKFASKMNAEYENFTKLLYSLLSHTEELQRAKEQVAKENRHL